MEHRVCELLFIDSSMLLENYVWKISCLLLLIFFLLSRCKAIIYHCDNPLTAFLNLEGCRSRILDKSNFQDVFLPDLLPLFFFFSYLTLSFTISTLVHVVSFPFLNFTFSRFAFSIINFHFFSAFLCFIVSFLHKPKSKST